MQTLATARAAREATRRKIPRFPRRFAPVLAGRPAQPCLDGVAALAVQILARADCAAPLRSSIRRLAGRAWRHRRLKGGDGAHRQRGGRETRRSVFLRCLRCVRTLPDERYGSPGLSGAANRCQLNPAPYSAAFGEHQAYSAAKERNFAPRTTSTRPKTRQQLA